MKLTKVRRKDKIISKEFAGTEIKENKINKPDLVIAEKIREQIIKYWRIKAKFIERSCRNRVL
jgi:hypothetical protein